MATDIKLLSTTAVKSSLDELLPHFEQLKNCKVVPNYIPSAQIAIRVTQGETYDVAIATAEVIAHLTGQGKIVQGSGKPIARSEMGLAVQQGAAKPDISSAEKFKEALLNAKSIITSNPVSGGQSGRHLVAIFDRLGITEALKPKIQYGPGGPTGLIGLFLARREVEIGIQQMPELLAVPGIDIVGPLPADIQSITVFSAGVLGTAENSDAGEALVQFLAGAKSAAVFQSKGMLP